MHIDNSFIQRTFNLHIVSTVVAWLSLLLTLKCMTKCSTPRGSVRMLDLQKTVSNVHGLKWHVSYAIGLALAHLFHVGSP